MSTKRLIVIKHLGEFKRAFHIKARIKTKENIGEGSSLLEAIRHIQAVTGQSFGDDCSVQITIGEAWVDDWNKIERQVCMVMAERVGWVQCSFKVLRPGKDQGSPPETKVMHIVTEDFDAKAAEWMAEAKSAKKRTKVKAK